jgi:hypothetical protein
MRHSLLRRIARLDHHGGSPFRGLFLLIGIFILALGVFAIMRYYNQLELFIPLSEEQLFLFCGIGSAIGGLYIIFSNFSSGHHY